MAKNKDKVKKNKKEEPKPDFKKEFAGVLDPIEPQSKPEEE